MAIIPRINASVDVTPDENMPFMISSSSFDLYKIYV
jgi:hypothetical protein